MLDKKKYKKSEVESILEQKESEYNAKLSELKEKTEILSKENAEIKSFLEEYKKKDSLINSSIKAAAEKAAELESRAVMNYRLEEENLHAFIARFEGYFKDLTEKYPHYAPAKSAAEVYENIKKILSEKGDAKDRVNGADKLLKQKSAGKEKIFDPKKRIDAYIASTGDNGFNLDEVLNPGELKLEDLCKELGLTEE